VGIGSAYNPAEIPRGTEKMNKQVSIVTVSIITFFHFITHPPLVYLRVPLMDYFVI
jgi:hypothetical protein